MDIQQPSKTRQANIQNPPNIPIQWPHEKNNLFKEKHQKTTSQHPPFTTHLGLFKVRNKNTNSKKPNSFPKQKYLRYKYPKNILQLALLQQQAPQGACYSPARRVLWSHLSRASRGLWKFWAEKRKFSSPFNSSWICFSRLNRLHPTRIFLGLKPPGFEAAWASPI